METVEDHVGFGSVLFQEFEIVSGVHRDGLRETVQEAQERIVGARNDKKRDGVHETRKITRSEAGGWWPVAGGNKAGGC